VRRAVWATGLRYRVDAPLPIPGVRRRADLLFSRARVVVFVDGCFWHSCPKCRLVPKANAEWWAAKLARNVARDRDTDRRLKRAGWRVVRVREHESPSAGARRVARLVAQRERSPRT
jgi:DNA mismatch endonuclease, patch repair protein